MATRLQLLIDGDASGARRALDDVAGGVDQTQSKLGKFNTAMSKATVPAAATVASLAAVGKASVDSASALEQSAGAVESVFGTYAGQVEAQAQQAAQNVGLAESQYNDLAAVLGAQLGNMGVSQDQLASQTDNLVGLGADLAATFGGDTSEAVAALSSLMRGERDPIERYGVSIKAADVEAKKAAMGLAGLEGEADAAATTQATLALVMDQTAGAQGAFAREAETAAGQQQRANAEFENAKAALGAGLLPVVSQAAGVLQTFAQWVQENSTLVGVLAVVIGTLAAGVLLYNGITAALPAIQAVATAAQWAWNAAMSANPIGLIILAIAALIAIIVLVVQSWDTVKAVALACWDAILVAIQAFVDWLGGIVQWIVDVHVAAWNLIRDGAAAAWEAVTSTVQGFFDWIGGIAKGIADAHVAAWNLIRDGASTAWNAVTSTVQRFFDWIGGIARRVADAHVAAWNLIRDGASTAWQAVTSTVQRFFDWIGRGVSAVPNAFRDGFNRARDWVSSIVDRMWTPVESFIDKIASIPRRIESALGSVRLPSWVTRLSGVLGFSTSGAGAYYAASMTASTWSPSRGVASSSSGGYGAQIINVTVNGALDKDATARTIVDILNQYGRRTGRVPINGAVIA